MNRENKIQSRFEYYIKAMQLTPLITLEGEAKEYYAWRGVKALMVNNTEYGGMSKATIDRWWNIFKPCFIIKKTCGRVYLRLKDDYTISLITPTTPPTLTNKKCVICNTLLFSNRKKTCNDICAKELKKAKRKEYNNKPDIKARRAVYMKKYNNKPDVKVKREAYQKRPEVIKKQATRMKRPEVRSNMYKYIKDRRKTDQAFALRTRFSNLLNIHLKAQGVTKSNTCFNLMGYTIEDLKRHLELQFTDGMSWDNRSEWHIDHIRPVASFNFTTTECEDFKKCWALNNLQPLWASDNIRKRDKWDGEINA